MTGDRLSSHATTFPSVTSSGRLLIVAMLVLFVCDVIGGSIGVASGAETWGTAWGFDTASTVPLPALRVGSHPMQP
jgi:hypothetical protein